MYLFPRSLIPSLLIAAALAADPIQVKDVNNCPGAYFVNNGQSGCCVGGEVDPPFLSVCEGWPICQGPTTTTWTQTSLSCATIVTDGPDYDAQISSASASLQASGTNYVTRLDGGAVVTTTTPARGQSGSTGAGTTATRTGSGGTAAETSEAAAMGSAAQMGLGGSAFLAVAAIALL
ncbi:hypothetical protein K449DRAFT_467069 [Hypoxylon sp. EC38]|nr:hypothetical protein K449DRAFT_467069 [Hypoxylon sp. EC38]